MKIYLDDIRYPSEEGWSIVRKYMDFFFMWQVNKHLITHISLDHDLGEEKTGYDALSLIEEEYLALGFDRPIVITVHTANPVGREKMTKVINRIMAKMLENHCK